MNRIYLPFALAIFLFTSPNLTIKQAIANPTVYDSDYTVELVASGLGAVTGVKLGPDGNIYLTDYQGGRILRIDKATYAVEEYTTGLSYPTDLTFDSLGNLFVTSGSGNPRAIFQAFPDGSKSLFSTGYSYSVGLETGADDYLFIGNSGDGTISRIDSDGISETYLSGFGGPGGPFGLTFDEEGNIYFVRHGTGQIYKSTPDKTVTTLATLTPFGPTYIRVDPSTKLYVSDSLNAAIYRISGNDVTLFALGFTGNSNPPVIGPSGLSFNDSGDLFVGDGGFIWKFKYKTLLQKIQELIEFFNESIADGSIEGIGRGNSANGRLNALRNILETASDLIDIDDIEGACGQLKAALKKCDGASPPPDFVQGEAVEELNDMISDLMAELGCE